MAPPADAPSTSSGTASAVAGSGENHFKSIDRVTAIAGLSESSTVEPLLQSSVAIATRSSNSVESEPALAHWDTPHGCHVALRDRLRGLRQW